MLWIAISGLVVLILSGCAGDGGDPAMPGSGTALAPVPMVPAGHGIAGGSEITVQPGASEAHGNVVVSCPAGGPACDLTVAADGTVSYRGGLPSVRYVLEPGGLVAGSVPDVFADSDADTLKRLLPTGGSTFPPLTAAVQRNYVEPDRGIRRPDQDAAYLESIASDGAGGFHVTYVIEGVATPVHFAAGDYGDGDFVKELDGTRYYLWSRTGSFILDPDDPSDRRDDGNRFHDYLDAVGWSVVSSNGVNDDYRGYATFGVRTSDLPPGRAAYGANMFAELWDGDDPDTRSGLSRVAGNMVLEADFAASELSGVVQGLRVREPGAARYAPMARDNALAISDGRIADGLFSARWTGSGTGDGVGGLEGTILGAFYGPAAAEAGGVLSGSDAASARHLFGYFRGDRLESTVPEGDLALASAAIHRDFAASAVASSDAAVTAITSDGVGGYRVTYRVDGAERTVHLEARDHGSSARCATCYHQRTDGRSWVFWNPGSYSRVPEFDHFDVAAWAVTDWRDAGHTEASMAGERRGFAVYGVPTQTLPSGTASYQGRAYAEIQPRDDPAAAARSRIGGRLALTADFGAGTVGGAIEGIEVRGPGQSAYAPTSGRMLIGNGAIADTGLTADLTGTRDHAGFAGAMTGRFYGPAAEEVGGLLTGTYSGDDTLVTGYFGGAKQ